MKKLTILILALIVLISCSSKGYWYKPDAQDQEFAKDNYSCSYQAKMLYYTSGFQLQDFRTALIAQSIIERKTYNNCMMIKGYQWTKNPQ